MCQFIKLLGMYKVGFVSPQFACVFNKSVFKIPYCLNKDMTKKKQFNVIPSKMLGLQLWKRYGYYRNEAHFMYFEATQGQCPSFMNLKVNIKSVEMSVWNTHHEMSLLVEFLCSLKLEKRFEINLPDGNWLK